MPITKRVCMHCGEWTEIENEVCPNCGFEIEKVARRIEKNWSMFFWLIVFCGVAMFIAFMFFD